MNWFIQKMCWATFSAISSQTHLVTLITDRLNTLGSTIGIFFKGEHVRHFEVEWNDSLHCIFTAFPAWPSGQVHSVLSILAALPRCCKLIFLHFFGGRKWTLREFLNLSSSSIIWHFLKFQLQSHSAMRVEMEDSQIINTSQLHQSRLGLVIFVTLLTAMDFYVILITITNCNGFLGNNSYITNFNGLFVITVTLCTYCRGFSWNT
jgi:hypothetical protein